MAEPPHLFLSWSQPVLGSDGSFAQDRSYDILESDATRLALRNEDQDEITAAGGRVIWILHLTDAGAGYCWGRADWPQVRCENRQVRCDAAAASS